MSDDLSKRGPPDKSRINVNERWEVTYWTNHFGITEDTLRRAVSAAGVMRVDVENWLRRNGHIR